MNMPLWSSDPPVMPLRQGSGPKGSMRCLSYSRSMCSGVRAASASCQMPFCLADPKPLSPSNTSNSRISFSRCSKASFPLRA